MNSSELVHSQGMLHWASKLASFNKLELKGLNKDIAIWERLESRQCHLGILRSALQSCQIVAGKLLQEPKFLLITPPVPLSEKN
jgi:hypothetical protein